MPDESEEEKPQEVDRGLVCRLNAESDGTPKGAVPAANLEIARRKAAGEPEVISPITKAYFEGFKTPSGVGDLSAFATFAQGFRTAIEDQNLGFKFVDGTFVESMRTALDQQLPSFKVPLAEEVLKGFKFDVLAEQIRGNILPDFKATPIPALWDDPTPTADLDIIRATIDEPDEEPTTIEEVPAEVVTDIHVARVVIREEVVHALNEAMGDRKPKKDTPLWFKWAVGIVAICGGTAGLLKAFGVF